MKQNLKKHLLISSMKAKTHTSLKYSLKISSNTQTQQEEKKVHHKFRDKGKVAVWKCNSQ